MLKKLFIAFLILSTTNVVFAKTAESGAKKEESISKERIDAAYKLLNEMNLKKVYENAVNNSTLRLVNSNKNFKSIEDKIRAFYQKYIGWDSVKEDLAKLYAKYYTVKELEDITNFYKTPTGKKVLATMGKVAYEGQMITQKRLRPHLNDLKKILDEAMFKKNEQKSSNNTKDEKKKEESKK